VDRKSGAFIKKEGLDKLHNANVLIVGLGGVGSLQLSFG
jgi:tRNA A37 threonylcarbamoyladenosine dehydratase